MKNSVPKILFSTFLLLANAQVSANDLIKQCSLPKYQWLMPMVIKAESTFRPFAINVNNPKPGAMFKQPKTYGQAIIAIEKLSKAQKSFDIGLSQINNMHFKPTGYLTKKGFKIEDTLDPCLNVLMGSLILDEAMERTNNNVGESLSIYNTGNKSEGFQNGYVLRVLQLTEAEKSHK